MISEHSTSMRAPGSGVRDQLGFVMIAAAKSSTRRPTTAPSRPNRRADRRTQPGHHAPAIVRAAMAHLNLVMIHPFRDGTAHVSLSADARPRPRTDTRPGACSIEEYLGRNTDSYYDILAEVGRGSWRPDGDAMPWVRYSLTAHYIQAMSVVRRIRESERIWIELDQLRTRRGLNERSMAALLDAATGLQVRNVNYRTVLRNHWQEDISCQVASLDLRAMVTSGLLWAAAPSAAPTTSPDRTSCRSQNAYAETAVPQRRSTL